MPVPVAVVALASTAFITFAAALLYALRGRRVDDHPICRRCGFDVSGRPAESNVCSECGADLAARRAIRIGRRERRRGLARVAGSGVFMSAVVLAGVGWVQLRGVDLQRHKPVWWLAREAGGTAAPRRDAALAELARRIALGKVGNITDAQLEPLLGHAFAHQADVSQPWVPGWGLLIEAARDVDRLSDSQWDRYQVQGVALRLKVRDAIRRGDPIPIEFWADPPRVGTPPPAGSPMSGRGVVGAADLAPELTIGGQVISDARHGPGTLLLNLQTPKPALLGSAIYEPPVSALAALPDGSHVAQVSCLVSLVNDFRTSSFLPHKRRQPVNQVLRASVRLVPAAALTVAMTTDESRRSVVEHSVQVRAADVDGTGALTLTLQANPPVSLASDVYLRQGGREWRAGQVSFESGRAERQFVTASCPGLAPGDAELVLRPSPAAAVRTAGVTEIWGGEIRITPVSLRRVGLATPGPPGRGP
jgi:hypothetical protein